MGERRRRVLAIIGTRPEAIKLSPVIRELRRREDQFECLVCLTAQHRELLDQALAPFSIAVDFDISIMQPGQSLADVTSRAVDGLSQVIAGCDPDLVMVQGDTATAFCGALAAYYHRTASAHVEAGLRTGDMYRPYPEEGYRKLIGQLASFHFAPTTRARDALLREGVAAEKIFVTGNTVIDALLLVRQLVNERQAAWLPEAVTERMNGREVVLVTGHRRESFGAGFENICRAIRTVADQIENVLFIYPVHLNPRVRQPVYEILDNHERIVLLEPLGYEPFVWLMDRADIVLTDSGGVQEEAPSLGKPVLVMRDTTERPEGIAAGNARLVGVDRDSIVASLTEILGDSRLRAKMGSIANPYGDGTASTQIIDILARKLQGEDTQH